MHCNHPRFRSSRIHYNNPHQFPLFSVLKPGYIVSLSLSVFGFFSSKCIATYLHLDRLFFFCQTLFVSHLSLVSFTRIRCSFLHQDLSFSAQGFSVWLIRFLYNSSSSRPLFFLIKLICFECSILILSAFGDRYAPYMLELFPASKVGFCYITFASLTLSLFSILVDVSHCCKQINGGSFLLEILFFGLFSSYSARYPVNTAYISVAMRLKQIHCLIHEYIIYC